MLLFLPVGSQATRHHLHAFWGQVQAAATIMGSRERHGPLPQLGDLQAGATCCPGGGGGVAQPATTTVRPAGGCQLLPPPYEEHAQAMSRHQLLFLLSCK